MLAYQFPPIMSSGCARPLAHVRYLRDYGYEPSVLTVDVEPDLPSDLTQLERIPTGINVVRVGWPSWEEYIARRVGSVSGVGKLLGKSQRWLSDGLEWRLRSWLPSVYRRYRQGKGGWTRPAIEAGIRLVRELRPELIWATGPPFETLKAASAIATATGTPLITDMRDPWTYGVCWRPAHQLDAWRQRKWERHVLQRSARVIFTTPLTERRMAALYPDLQAKFLTITNGFDDTPPVERVEAVRDKMVITYAGSIGTRYRCPRIVFTALEQLKREIPDTSHQLVVQFVGQGGGYQDELDQRGISEMVQFVEPVSQAKYRGYLQASDVLLLLQIIDDGNDVISGKLFDYLWARKPIIGVVNAGGGDDWLLQASAVGQTVGTQDPQLLADVIRKHFTSWQQGTLDAHVDPNWLSQFERRFLTRRLAEVMDEVVARKSCPAA